MRCPRCESDLTKRPVPGGLTYHCAICGGSATTLALARRLLSQKVGKQFWNLGREIVLGRVTCPACNRLCREVPVTVGGTEIPVDVCANCQTVWFDSGELLGLGYVESDPRRELSHKDPTLPQEVRKELAVLEIEREKALERLRSGAEPPEGFFQKLMGALGLPVESNIASLSRAPWVTWSITLTFILVFLVTLGRSEEAVQTLGLLSHDPFRYGGLTFISGFFVHKNLAMLVQNSYLLFTFGDNVEDRLGALRFSLLYFVSCIVGTLFYLAVQPEDATPLFPAGVGITAVLVVYAALFPEYRLQFYSLRLLQRWYILPVRVACFGWIAFQLLIALFPAEAALGAVSAHVGGILVGLVASVVLLKAKKRGGN